MGASERMAQRVGHGPAPRRAPRAHKPPGGRARAPLRVEILDCVDGLLGPAMAVADALRVVDTLAAMRGARDSPVLWQWTRPDGAAAPRHRPAHGPRGVRPDVIVVPGWHARSGPHLDRLVRRDHAAAERLRAVHRRGGHVLAFATGVALLGAAGLLEDREAVAPWPFIQSIGRHAPRMQLVSGEPWVQSERVWTCDSPALATEVLLELLRVHGLQALADSAGHVLLHSRERQRLSGRVAAESRGRIGPGTLERARRWLEDHLDRPYSLDATARAAATSPRSLLRHFRATYGQTPLQYLHEVRATRARMLLETTYLTVDSVAELCGYRDAAMFRRVFAAFAGMGPAAYRERFRLRSRRREWGRDLAR